MSINIDFEKVNFLEKSKPSHELCESYIIKKQYCTSFGVINQIDLFKYATQKYKSFYSNIAKVGKMERKLKEAQYVFAFSEDKIDMTEMHFF